jgi:lipopolysaccharide export system protein LptC
MAPHGIELSLPDLPEVPMRLGPVDSAPPAAAEPKEPRGWRDRLREGLAIYLPLLLMAVLAIFTGWLVKSSPRPAPQAAEAAVRAGPDYAMTGFRVQRHGADGRIQLVLEGDRLRHFAQTRSVEVEGARVQAFTPSGAHTQATALRATANDEATEVTLSGGVQLRGKLSDGRDLEIDSEFLSWSTESDRLRTHLPVRVKVGHQELQAAALDYDRAHQRLQLKGPLRGQWARQGDR